MTDTPLLDAYLDRQISRLREATELADAQRWHQAIWGVPCGPTLTMVYPTVLRGITP
jgi:hypothetical protein